MICFCFGFSSQMFVLPTLVWMEELVQLIPRMLPSTAVLVLLVIQEQPVKQVNTHQWPKHSSGCFCSWKEVISTSFEEIQFQKKNQPKSSIFYCNFSGSHAVLCNYEKLSKPGALWFNFQGYLTCFGSKCGSFWPWKCIDTNWKLTHG